MEETLVLNKLWRERIEEIGLKHFVREEMLRLGFVSDIDEGEKKKLRKFLDQAFPKLSELKKELSLIQGQINRVADIELLLKEIRRERIARIKEERKERKSRKVKEKKLRHEAWKEKQLKTPVFLGVSVSSRLKFEGGNQTLLTSHNLPIINNLEELALKIGITSQELTWLCYERQSSNIDHYSRFEIPKKTGGKRIISSPKPKMRLTQAWILKNILDNIIPSLSATAFTKGASTVKNASAHLNSKIVIKIDFKDFFPSINFPRIRGYFESIGYNSGIASIFALITTDAPRVKTILDGKSQFVAIGDRSLPQGACTSPSLANLICRKLDSRLAGLCKSMATHWSYTRYADDLTFSNLNDDSEINRILKAVKRISEDEGFKLNPDKTRIMRSPGRQIVTGLLVGERIRISRKDLKIFRSFLYNCDRIGLNKVSKKINKDALSVAHGRLGYVKMVMPELANKIKEKYKWL